MTASHRRPGGIDVRGRRVQALDEAFMRRALELAALARGRTHPNPMVGCVIVRDGRIIGEGWHRAAGLPHAEAEAIADAGGPAAVRGASVYVTLEPCAHYGRTPPCADLLVQAAPREVIIAHGDPNPRVQGRGIAKLRAAGIDVQIGVCAAEARRLNEAWLTATTAGRPFFALKYAMTLDGKIAAASGQARWITGEAARSFAHRLRDRYDAILVGIGTVLQDDPQLTCRLVAGRDPIRVILDRSARLPVTAQVLRVESDAPCWVFVGGDAPPARVKALEEAGARVFPVPSSEAGVDLNAVAATLAREQIVSVLVEGGARVHRSFLTAGLADKLYAFIGAKTVAGDDAPGPIAGAAVATMQDAGRWSIRDVHDLAPDVCLEAYPLRETEPST